MKKSQFGSFCDITGINDYVQKRQPVQICDVEGEGTMHRNTAAIWFKRFTNGDTSLENKSRSERQMR